MSETNWPNLREDDFIIRDFRFASGETLPELRQHFITLGTPRTDAAGRIVNASLLIHNTTGTGKTWLEPSLAGELFGPGQPLDAAKNFLIIPDIIGFGRSSKPSDGLRARFPHYRLHDVAVAQHRLVTEGLKIPRAEARHGPVARRHADLDVRRDVPGLHGRAGAGREPARADERPQLDPAPHQCRGDPQRSRMEGRRLRDAADRLGSRRAAVGDVHPERRAHPGDRHRRGKRPTRSTGGWSRTRKKGDANNRLYQIESTMDYDPSADLEKIKAKLFAINFADDAVNPPELGVLEAGVARIPGARCVVVPATPQSLGHQSSMHAAALEEPSGGIPEVGLPGADPADSEASGAVSGGGTVAHCGLVLERRLGHSLLA